MVLGMALTVGAALMAVRMAQETDLSQAPRVPQVLGLLKLASQARLFL